MSSIYETKKLLEDKKTACDACNHLAIKVKTENRSMTPEELEQFDKMTNDIVNYNAMIETATRLDKSAELQSQPSELRVNISGDRKPKAPESLITNKDREWALRGYLINQSGYNGQKYQRREFTEAAEKVGLDFNRSDYEFNLGRFYPFWYPAELRVFTGQNEGGATGWNQGGAVGAGGGFLTQQSLLIKELEVFTKWHSGMYMASKVVRTDDTGSMAWKPQLDDTLNAASIHLENTQLDGLDAVFSHKAIPAFVYDSFVMATLELLQDSELPLEEILSTEVLSIRIARKENTDYTSGSGVGLPEGIKTAVLAAGAGQLYTSTVAGLFEYQDIVNAIYKLDWSYLQDSSYAMMISQSAYKHFWGLVDSANRPLMSMSMQEIAPNERLLGRRVIINNDLDAFASAGVIGIAGAWRCSLIRNVGGLNIRTLQERFIYDNLAIGIASWKRAGYACVNPKGFIALKVL